MSSKKWEISWDTDSSQICRIISLFNKKRIDRDFSVQIINEVNIYNFQSSDLPGTQQLPSHLHMTYDFRNHIAENGFLTIEPQQLPSHHLQFDSRNHVAEITIQGVEREELVNMVSNYRNHVAENIFSTEESQLLPNQLLAIDHVAEKIFPGVEYLLLSQYLTSECRNHVAEKKIFLRWIVNNHPVTINLTSDYRNHVAENNFPMDESQLLPSHHSASRSGNHVAENNYPQVESQQQPSHYSMSDFRDHVAEHSFSVEEYMLSAQYSDGQNCQSLPALRLAFSVEMMDFLAVMGCITTHSLHSSPLLIQNRDYPHILMALVSVLCSIFNLTTSRKT